MAYQPFSTASRIAIAAILAACFLSAVPARAESQCHQYCSGPGKSYKDCMEQCIERQQYRSPRDAGRSVRDLCRSKNTDEEECLRQYYGNSGNQYGNSRNRYENYGNHYDHRRY
ncbi:MAG: hypothetical protein GC191_04220 [Azospirillum sp.]|nr:hypothetical protein [Azospirillum sp.]